jgi:molybdopterin converting factor small subunit
MPRIVVILPTPLRRAAGGTREVEAEGETVAEALSSLRRLQPAVARLILQESDAPRPGVSLFLNETAARDLGGLGAPLAPGDRLSVVLPIAGGRQPPGVEGSR